MTLHLPFGDGITDLINRITDLAITGQAPVSNGALVKAESSANSSPSDHPLPCLPDEILLHTFSYLEKPDLKSVRLTSNRFSQLVSDIIFGNIYISPCEEDMKTFTSITQSPNLARHVQTLTYDVSQFHRLFGSYDELWIHHAARLYLRRPELLPSFSTKLEVLERPGLPPSFITELEVLERMLRTTDLTLERLNLASSKVLSTAIREIVGQGGILYSMQRQEQEHCRYSKEFFDCLCLGLTRLPNLKTLAFEYEWNDQPDELLTLWASSPTHLPYSASSLARSWSPYYVKPGKPDTDYLFSAIFAALNALRSAEKSVDEIHFAHSLELPSFFFDHECEKPDPQSIMLSWNNHPTSIQYDHELLPTNRLGKTYSFKSFLRNIPNLKRLNISADQITDTCSYFLKSDIQG